SRAPSPESRAPSIDDGSRFMATSEKRAGGGAAVCAGRNQRARPCPLRRALRCAPYERDARLAARCANPSLRREVLACLNEHDEDFLESALTITNTFEHATSTDDVDAPPDVQPGERVGRYEVVGRLGAGGM